jgi:hypothetical protein
MLDKKGQGLSTTAIILIVLGVIVLVILAIGFMAGWNTVLPWLNNDNVGTIVQQCGVACNLDSVYDYCSMQRELTDSEGNEVKTSCAVLAIIPEFKKYGIEPCNINCDLPCDEITIDDKTGEVIETFEIKNCNEFDGKGSTCTETAGCTWTNASSKCTGNYKLPKQEGLEFYDVTSLSDISNPTISACGILK